MYISVVAEEGLKPADLANLEFLLLAMEAIGKQHVITRSFLGAAVEDVRRSGLAGRVRLPKVAVEAEVSDDGTTPPGCGSNIPIFARSRVSRHNQIMPPLPGRLPLNNPIGRDPIGRQVRREMRQTVFHPLNPWPKDVEVPSFRGKENTNKRRRVNVSPEPPGPLSAQTSDDPFKWFQSGPVEEISSSDNTPPTLGPSCGSRSNSGGAGDYTNPQVPSTGDTPYQYHLPHRAGSSTTGSSPSAALNSNPTPSSSETSANLLNTGQTTSGTLCPVSGNSTTTSAEIFHVPGVNQTNGVDLNMFQGMQGWDIPAAAAGGGPTGNGNNGGGGGLSVYSQQATEGLPSGGYLTTLDDESWMILNDPAVLNGGQSWGADMGPGVG